MRYTGSDFNLFLLALTVAGWAAILLAGCSGDEYCDLPPREVDSAEAAIINGTPSVDYRSVVYVKAAKEGPWAGCTGTIVGPHTVMTAGHCLEDATSVYIERDRPWRTLAHTTEWEVHPDHNKRDGLRRVHAADIAVVYTEEVLPEPYASVADTPTGCFVGMIAQGYGETEAGYGEGLREKVVYETFHNEWYICTTTGSCYGDSGSGLYALTPEGRTVIGVSSFVRHQDCSEGLRGAACYTNLYTYGQWVQERIR